MAALIGSYSGYVALAFLPPLVWLLFYLHEDQRPEPKQLLFLTFLGGIFAALLAVGVELAIFAREPIFRGFLVRSFPEILELPLVVFFVVALIEEYLKYFAVKVTVLGRRDFDEPVDAMVYLVTAALGFAAIENVIFLIPVFEEGFLGGVELTVNRFLGANLLHSLSSAIVGYALARHVFTPRRKHAVAVGVLAATVLHALFNYFIITREIIPEIIVLVVFLLSLMAVVVFADFERLKGERVVIDGEPNPR